MSKITNINDLKLPLNWQKEIQKIITDNVMLYEPLMETAPSSAELISRLKHRGYTNLPMGLPQALNFLKFDNIPIANISSKNIKKTMLRKGKK